MTPKNRILILFLFVLTAAGPPPKVAVDVAFEAQRAAFDDAPILPDDFAGNDPGRVSARWDTTQPDPVKTETVQARRTKSELESWVKERYSPSTPLERGVMNRGAAGQVWQHLVNDHGFSPSQVNGMQQWVANALHDAVHPKMKNGVEIDPPMISAWKSTEIIVPSSSNSSGGEMVLYTADSSWTCAPCNEQAAILSRGGVNFSVKKILVPSGGRSPASGRVPCWVAPDGTYLTGAISAASLNEFYAKYKVGQASQIESTAVRSVSVEIEGGTSISVLSALAEHVRRQSSPDEIHAAQGLLPELDADIDDGFLQILDGLMKPAGYQTGGLTVSWPGTGRKSLRFDPVIKIRFRKVVEIDVEMTSLTVDGRQITLSLNRFPDLTVRLK